MSVMAEFIYLLAPLLLCGAVAALLNAAWHFIKGESNGR